MDNFKHLENLQKELEQLQQKFNNYTELLETTSCLSQTYRTRIENQIGRTSCDIQNAKENIDFIRTSMKDGFIAQFIDLIAKMKSNLTNTQSQLFVLGLATGMINPFREISDFFLRNKVGEYFEDIVDFAMSLLTGLVKYLQSNDGVMDDLKINLYSLIELFDRIFLKDEFKTFEKIDGDMQDTQDMQRFVILLRPYCLILSNNLVLILKNV